MATEKETARTFTCESCHGTFEDPKDWTEEDRIKEMKENFGSDVDLNNTARVCDDCYNAIRRSIQ